MPYIKPEERPYFEPALLAIPYFHSPGQLNYFLTRVIADHLRKLAQSSRVGYTELNAVKGVLDEVKDEFRERVIKPYEEQKRAENGDVY